MSKLTDEEVVAIANKVKNIFDEPFELTGDYLGESFKLSIDLTPKKIEEEINITVNSYCGMVDSHRPMFGEAFHRQEVEAENLSERIGAVPFSLITTENDSWKDTLVNETKRAIRIGSFKVPAYNWDNKLSTREVSLDKATFN
ncbi:hypothetical protein [Evansella clarkii]|uniref:hypothetical protein n=1 Tax=Evansella clarkii TaxID=79879 RepID=UPI000997BCB5|nr:hypothetical protein [Evansella clarkii]